MDNYDPNRDLREQKTPDNCEPPTEPKDPLSATNFYKEFVQFAVFVGVTLFPIYVFFSDMTNKVQEFILGFVRPVKHGDILVSYALDRTFAQGVVVILFLLTFTVIFFARHALRARNRNNFTSSEPLALIDRNLITEKNEEIYRLKARLNKDMIVLRTIHNQVYDEGRARLNYESIKGIYYVNANGDLKVHKSIVLKADEKEGPFWTYFASGDEYSTPIENLEELGLSIIADAHKTDLLYLPLEDEPLKKKVAVYFLPLLKPAETRAFKLYYEWPGNFLKLIKTGSVSYDWQSRPHSPEAAGDFYAEWIFDEALGEVACQNTGSKPAGLELIRTDEKSPCRWIFHGQQIPFGGTPLELTFWISEPKTIEK